MNKILVAFILLGSLVSCDEVIEPLLKDDYFPLEVGNSWTFELAGTDSVTNVKTISGKEYFDISSQLGNTETYTQKRNKVYQLTADSEEMIFDLAAEKDETWEFGIGMVKMASRKDNIIIGDTVISKCLRFDFYSTDPNLDDYGHTIWLAPNLGYVQKNCQECYDAAFHTLKLRKAKIDGVVIDLE